MIQQTLRIVVATAAIYILGHASALAGFVQYKVDTGTCEDGSKWACVSLYVSGVYAWSDGVDCNGVHYHGYILCLPDHCIKSDDPNPGVHRVPVLDDPTLGLIPTHADVTDVGPWRSVIIRNASGIPTSVAGVADDGSFYKYEIDASTGGTDYH